MQLGRHARISGALAAASQALVNPAQATVLGEEADWRYEAALLYYGEEDDRVSAIEGRLQASATDADGRRLQLALTLDSLTGATPTGAVPQTAPQTFTRPSGRGEYVVAPGQTPLDDTFKDTRLQLNAGWATPLARNWETDLAAHLSKEYDYLSLGLSAGLTRSLNRNNTQLRLGGSAFFDTIEPEGRVPLPLATMPLRADYDSEEAFANAFAATRGNRTDHKRTAELTLGLTQTLTRTLVMQVNYGLAEISGYQSDAFKLLSVVDDSGTALRQLYESRPRRRTKHTLFWQAKAHFGAPVLDASYRYLHDDWGIDSHTLDLRLNTRLAPGHSLEPQFRFYRQSAADFYRPFLEADTPLPQHASADYRLAKMDTYTLGLKYALPVQGNEAHLRLSYYWQRPEGPAGPGQLSRLELYPEVRALILQLGYRF
ncbi:DUF3570 domain-containing protein [Ferrimonas balearica]|uniref:DUF3570 domain-containing protein n=1 Tax=Ferrimonas balearica TaxID=44012 RepID=UPI001C98F385|nr:DUF3570 domain-containing protein [Ferrimonas balearica]MBY5991446.1 DUF3570 domain-containing protein [Ferrimonas balearica]